MGEQLQTLPGIVINRLGLLSGSANIRGLTGERIGVLVDGERLPNLEFGPDLGSVDPFRVEHLEVLKGPASSIYGADAFGGVINIITTTPRPDAPFGVRAFAFGGGFAEYGGNLEITGPNFVIGTSRKVAGDAKDADGDLIPPQGTEYKVFDIYGTGRIDLSSRDRLELRFDRYRQDNADFGSEADRTFFAPSRGRVLSDPDLEPERLVGLWDCVRRCSILCDWWRFCYLRLCCQQQLRLLIW